MEALFLKILNLSLQASWIVLGVILFRLIFRKAPKYIRGILWSVAALRLVLPFSIESIVSLMPSKEVIPETIVYSPNPQINSGFESVDIIINPIITETFAPNPINSVNPLQIVNFVLACLWLIGIAVFLIYGAVNYILLYKRVSVSQNIGEGVYICDKIRTPFILGIIKPKIYLPSDIKETEKGYVIAHERAHLKRLDHIFKPLGFLILAVYWFNPIIWLGYVLFCRDMELACDERVVKDLTAEEKKSYSETLLSFGLSDGIAKTFSPAFGEIGIRARIKTVLNYKKPAFWVIIVALLLAAALAVGFLTDPISQNEETPDDTSSSVDSNGIDIIIPYKENWQEDYFTGEENKVVAVSGRNKNIKAYFVDYNIPYRYSDMIFEDGERVIIRNLKSPIYGSKIPEKIYLCDIDGDQIDEIILPDAYWVNGGYCSLVYKITDNGFEEFLNTKDISDYGYYLEPNTHNDNLVNIKNKYVNEYDYFSSLSSNKKYFYGEDGNFKTNITIEYSAITNTDFQDVNGDGILEIIIDRYAVVRGCPAAILTKTAFSYNGEKFVIVDTAGIRKKSKVNWGVEKFAVDRAIRSIRDCDVALLVIDATEGISDQDKKIASIVTEAGKGLIIAINKWDLVENKKSNTINQFDKNLTNEIPFLEYAPKIYISAVTKQRLNSIFDKAKEVYEQCTKRVSTGLLNKVIKEAYALNPPTSVKGKRLKILYTTQAAIQPPTFVLFTNNGDLMKDHYKRYIENKLREAFGFFGTSIRISVRERSEKEKK